MIEAITPADLRKIGIDKPKKICIKANELLRMLDVKCPMGLPSNLGSFGAVCKPTVCIELACKLNSTTFSKEEAVRGCGVNMFDYQMALITIQNILKLKFPVSIQELCVHFACPGMKSTVDKLLEQYQERFIESLSNTSTKTDSKEKTATSSQKKADFSNPAFKAAAFFLSAKHCKLKVDRTKLIQFTNCNPNQFNSVCESMEKVCSFSALAAASTFQEFRERNKKRKRVDKETTEDKTEAEDDAVKELLKNSVRQESNTKKENVSVATATPSTTPKVKEEAKTEEVKQPPRKKLRQMNLNFFVEKKT
jgi:hypothetical protein